MIASGRYERDDLTFRWTQPDVHSDALWFTLAEGRPIFVPFARPYVVPRLTRAE